MYPRISTAVWLAALLAHMPVSAAATTLVPADFPEMVRDSELIVHGTVVNVQAQTVGPRRTIESLVTLRVVDAIKGTAAEFTVFRVPGGRIGRYRRVMVGAPQFATGDEVILFLNGSAPAIPTPYGLSQGVYRVGRGGATASVTPLVPTGSGRIVRGDPSRRSLDAAAFAAAIRAVLAGGSSSSPRTAAPSR